MKYGFVLPLGDARMAADLAVECERAGWDGFFVWEPVWGWEAWILLAAAAMRTERIRLGTMLTPVSRMRPWKLAGESVTVDHVSDGRVILAVGLGAPDSGFGKFNEVTDRKTRAELLDEGLDILIGLWSGSERFGYSGKHYTILADERTTPPPPPPVQTPRIPIWVVGAWPRPKSMARALRYDGMLPQAYDAAGKPRELVPDDFRDVKAYVEQQREQSGPFELIMEGTTPGDPAQAAAKVRPWAEAGATWWIEGMWETIEQPDGPERVFERARRGPPRL